MCTVPRLPCTKDNHTAVTACPSSDLMRLPARQPTMTDTRPPKHQTGMQAAWVVL